MLNFFLILLFIRPFISSLAFPYADSIYWLGLFVFLLCWIILSHRNFNKLKFRFRLWRDQIGTKFRCDPAEGGAKGDSARAKRVPIWKDLPLNEGKSIKYPLALFISALLVSAFFSTHKNLSLRELSKYAAYLLVFLISASFTDKEKIKIIRAILLAGFIIGLLTIYQYFFGFQHLLDYTAKKGITNQFALDYIVRKRVFFPFVTPNALAGYLIMIIPLTLIYRQTILLVIPLILCLFLTQSLGALLSLFLGVIIYFYLQVQGKFRKRSLLILLGLLAMAGFILIMRMETQKEHFQLAFSTTMRLSYWQETIQLIKSHPFIGVGPGNFDLTDSRYAHNSYLQLWAETGILGMSAFIWLIFTIFRPALKNINYPGGKKLTLCLYTASIVFLTHNFIDFTFFLPEISLIWWTIMGLLISFRHLF